MSIREAEKQLESVLRSAIGAEVHATRIGGCDWCITGRMENVNAAVRYLEVSGVMIMADAEPDPAHYDREHFIAYMRPRE